MQDNMNEISRNYISLPRRIMTIATNSYTTGKSNNKILHILAPLSSDGLICIGIGDGILGIWSRNGIEKLSIRKDDENYVVGNFKTGKTKLFCRLDDAYLYLLKAAPAYGAHYMMCETEESRFLAHKESLNASALIEGVEICDNDDDALTQKIFLADDGGTYFERVLCYLWKTGQWNEPNRFIMSDGTRIGQRVELYAYSEFRGLPIRIIYDDALNRYLVDQNDTLASSQKSYRTFKMALKATCQLLLDESNGAMSNHERMELYRELSPYMDDKTKKSPDEYFLPLVQT